MWLPLFQLHDSVIIFCDDHRMYCIILPHEIKKAFVNKDRDEMLKRTRPYYKDLSMKGHISHFYLTGRYRYNLNRDIDLEGSGWFKYIYPNR